MSYGERSNLETLPDLYFDSFSYPAVASIVFGDMAIGGSLLTSLFTFLFICITLYVQKENIN